MHGQAPAAPRRRAGAELPRRSSIAAAGRPACEEAPSPMNSARSVGTARRCMVVGGESDEERGTGRRIVAALLSVVQEPESPIERAEERASCPGGAALDDIRREVRAVRRRCANGGAKRLAGREVDALRGDAERVAGMTPLGHLEWARHLPLSREPGAVPPVLQNSVAVCERLSSSELKERRQRALSFWGERKRMTAQVWQAAPSKGVVRRARVLRAARSNATPLCLIMFGQYLGLTKT